MPSVGFLETPQEARRIWLAALRSGEYERCRTFLGMLTPEGRFRFSSLGVACEEFRKRYPEQAPVTEVALAAAGYLCFEYRDGGAAGERFYLPEKVRCWLGLSDVACTLQPHYAHLGYETLCELDDDNVAFDKLADLIEADALLTMSEASASDR